MPKDRTIHVEHMAVNRVLLREPYWRRKRRDAAPRIDPAPLPEKRVHQHDMLYHNGDRPHAHDAIKRTKRMRESLLRAEEDMPQAGFFWHRQRCDDPRTVTEEDLADLKDARAKHARDWGHATDNWRAPEPWCKDAETQTEEPLKMYSLERSKNAPSHDDAYTGAVVIARNEDEAKFIHPGSYYKGKAWWHDRDENFEETPEVTPVEVNEWVYPAYVRSTHVCDYYGPEKQGYVVSSSYWMG